MIRKAEKPFALQGDVSKPEASSGCFQNRFHRRVDASTPGVRLQRKSLVPRKIRVNSLNGQN
jgi:hypothetical protein